MKSYRYEITKHQHGRYVLAISSQSGFAHYKTYPCTKYFEQLIRKTIRRFCEVPKQIDWSGVPSKDFIEWAQQ